MDQSKLLGLAILVIGVALVLVAILLLTGGISWLGRLPGDIRFTSGRTRVYIPLTSMILLSVVLTLVINLLRRLF